MSLPIDVIPTRSGPPKFRWQQTLSTPTGPRTVTHEGTLAPTVEEAVAALIALTKRQMVELEVLRRQKAETVPLAPQALKKAKG